MLCSYQPLHACLALQFSSLCLEMMRIVRMNGVLAFQLVQTHLIYVSGD